MKTAKAAAQAIILDCPKCGETIPSPSGSLFWSVDEYAMVTVIRCECGEASKMPKAAAI